MIGGLPCCLRLVPELRVRPQGATPSPRVTLGTIHADQVGDLRPPFMFLFCLIPVEQENKSIHLISSNPRA